MEPEVHYLSYNSLPPFPTLSQINPGRAVTFHILNIHLLLARLLKKISSI
jgi:hypothetical protein